MPTAHGTFEVKLTPQEGSGVGRMSIDKKFSGDLDASSEGTMLAVRGTVKGSAGYVAIEVVNGMLGGRSGSFALQHWGVMTRGEPEQRVMVIPDSGAGDLAGISGAMTIIVEDGKHAYELHYSL
jgi:hypothetical protein